MGTVNLLEAARKNPLQRFFYMSTSEVYGSNTYPPIDERHPINPQSPYAASKVAAEQATISYSQTFGLPFTIGRPFNNFGPRQSTRAVIPNLITQALSPRVKQVKVGSLTARRDFIFVSNCVETIVKAAISPKMKNEVVNIGSGASHSIEEIYSLICQATNTRKRLVLDPSRVRPGKSDLTDQVCDNGKMLELLGKPPRKFTSCLRQTVKWYSRHLKNYRPERFCI
jgi:dTDP-glucose 4,6-dehydratase